MSRHLWGLHHLPYHQSQQDWEHIARMGYRSAKVFEWCYGDRGYVDKLLATMPGDALFVARDHPLSEQHDDLERTPWTTGIRHADEWAAKVKEGKMLLPVERTLLTGINEPHVWSHLHQAIEYEDAYLARLTEHGLRGGALRLGVGWPGTKGGDPSGLPDWEPYEPVHYRVKRGNHVLILHEYGAYDNPGFGHWLMRLRHCPWRDVQILVGECGIDQAVAGGEHKGWQRFLSAAEYANWLDLYHLQLTGDGRVHSAQIFTYDFSQPWASFDVRPAAQALEAKTWTWGSPRPVTKVHIPTVTTPAPVPSGDTWTRSIERLLGEEGGFQKHPDDDGNYYNGQLIGTNWGISAASWAWKYDIPSLTRETAIQIYFTEYWQASGADKLAWPLCFLVLDTAVLHGVGTAKAWLAEVGPDPLLFAAKRLRSYLKDDDWKVFGWAWVNRVANLLEAMA